jgi:hypothetical protein
MVNRLATLVDSPAVDGQLIGNTPEAAVRQKRD